MCKDPWAWRGGGTSEARPPSSLHPPSYPKKHNPPQSTIHTCSSFTLQQLNRNIPQRGWYFPLMSRGRSQYGRTGDAKLLPFSPPLLPNTTVLVFQSAPCVQTHMQRQSMCQNPEGSRVKWNKVWRYGRKRWAGLIILQGSGINNWVCVCVCVAGTQHILFSLL